MTANKTIVNLSKITGTLWLVLGFAFFCVGVSILFLPKPSSEIRSGATRLKESARSMDTFASGVNDLVASEGTATLLNGAVQSLENLATITEDSALHINNLKAIRSSIQRSQEEMRNLSNQLAQFRKSTDMKNIDPREVAKQFNDKLERMQRLIDNADKMVKRLEGVNTNAKNVWETLDAIGEVIDPRAVTRFSSDLTDTAKVIKKDVAPARKDLLLSFS